jgi:hypothetical protein
MKVLVTDAEHSVLDIESAEVLATAGHELLRQDQIIGC